MTEFILGSGGPIDVQTPTSPKALETETVLVLLEEFQVRRLLSKDFLGSSREGTLAISVGNQATSLSWSRPNGKDATVKNPEKFRHYVLFLGRPEVNLDVSFNVVETDNDAVNRLRRVNAAASAASAIAYLLPGTGTIVSAGLKMLGGILDFLTKQFDDDIELFFHASITRESSPSTGQLQLQKGTYKIIRKVDNPSEPPDIEVNIGVYNFKPLPENQQHEVLVVLDSITITVPPSNPEEPDLTQRTLVFDATVGGGENAVRFDFRGKIRNRKASIDKVVGIKDKVLYQGPWTMGVPFTFSLAAVGDSNELDAVEGLVDIVFTQTKKFTKKQSVQHTIDNATKAVQSVRSLLIEFLPRKFSIGTKSGLIVDRSSIIDSDLISAEIDEHHKLYLLNNLSGTQWSRVPIVLKNETSPASAEVVLKIKYLP